MVERASEERTPTAFESWVRSEGLSVTQQQMVPDVYSAELQPWERAGVDATLLDLTTNPPGNGSLVNQGTSRYLCEIPKGGVYKAERHMYEEIFYVLSGRGATTVWYEGSPKQTFEWTEGSIFSIPLNAWHELYNGSGESPARLYAMFTAPMVFNIYGSKDYIFNCDSTFPERFDPYDETYFSGKSVKLKERLSKTNFVANVRTMSLDNHGSRGPGTNMHAIMANGHFITHVSEFPGQTYKKAHTAGGGVRVKSGLTSEVAYLFLNGEGFDLQWGSGVQPAPGVPFERMDYGAGTLLTPGDGYHQHFNATPDPIRYLVLRFGNPFLVGGGGREDMPPQIEFDDEDPAVWDLFVSELGQRGLEPRMEGYKTPSAVG